MTHEELLKTIDGLLHLGPTAKALRAVVELHRPVTDPVYRDTICDQCREYSLWPCDTLKAIEKELA